MEYPGGLSAFLQWPCSIPKEDFSGPVVLNCSSIDILDQVILCNRVLVYAKPMVSNIPGF